jgi:hypothetical protein
MKTRGMKFYMFDQNNSGGEFDVDENVAHHVVIEARDENHAVNLLRPMPDIRIHYFDGTKVEITSKRG